MVAKGLLPDERCQPGLSLSPAGMALLVGGGCHSSTPLFIQQHPSYALWGPGPGGLWKPGVGSQHSLCLLTGNVDRVGHLPLGSLFMKQTTGAHLTSADGASRSMPLGPQSSLPAPPITT